MEATNPTQWIVTSGYEQALRAYNDWVFGPNPVYTPGDPELFIHGNINSPAVRSESPAIGTDTLIVVHVVGVNFIIGDIDTRGNKVVDDSKPPVSKEIRVTDAVQFSAQNEDRKEFVQIKPKQVSSWTDLTSRVRDVRYPPSDFIADRNNPHLNQWDVPMPPGPQRGAWASKLLLLKIPVAGNFELKSQGRGISPYQQKTNFDITVQ